MSSFRPGLISSRCPSGGRYRPSAARNWTRAGITSPVVVSTISTSIRRVGVRQRFDRQAPNRTRAPSAGSRFAGTTWPRCRSWRPPSSRRRRASRAVCLVVGKRDPPADDRAWHRHHRPAARCRALPEYLAEVDRHRWPPALPSIRRVRRGSTTSGEAVPRNAVTAATTTPPPSSSRASGSIRRRASAAGRRGPRSHGARSRCRRSDSAPCPRRPSAPDPSCPAGSRAVRHLLARHSRLPGWPDTDLASRAACRPGARGRQTHPAPSR